MSDVIVVGAGIPALQTALDLAEVGLQVALAPGRAGAGEMLPTAGERDPDGGIATLLQRVHEPLPGTTQSPTTGISETIGLTSPLLQGRTGAYLPQPEPNVWGIPAVPLAEATIALLGTGGALRAYRDRLAPLLTVGKTRMLGSLVRKRLGRRAFGVLVEPQARERFGVSADDVEVAVAAPGFNEALTRAGALTTAVLAYQDRYVQRETLLAPVGGWQRLADHLRDRLALYTVEHLDAEVVSCEMSALDTTSGGGQWRVSFSDGQVRAARAVVVEAMPYPAGSVNDPAKGGLAPTHMRIYAETGIEPWPLAAPDDGGAHGGAGADSGAGTLDGAAAQPALITHPAGWVARVEGGVRVRLSGPRVAAGAVVADPPPLLDQVLGELGLTRAADHDWAWSVRAAPDITLDERHRRQQLLEVATAEEPSIAHIGRALHGDELSAALVAAHEGAVALRRRLLGLAEG